MLTFFCGGIGGEEFGLHCDCGKSYLLVAFIPILPLKAGRPARPDGVCPSCHDPWVKDRARTAAAAALCRLGANGEDILRVLAPEAPFRRGFHQGLAKASAPAQ